MTVSNKFIDKCLLPLLFFAHLNSSPGHLAPSQKDRPFKITALVLVGARVRDFMSV